MKFTALKPAEITATAIRAIVDVRYEDEDMPFDAPCRTGDKWDVTIDLETGRIKDWPEGSPLDLHMKVCCGEYRLLNEDVVIVTREGYVPDCFPGEHYGDYLIMNIDASGVITNWKARPEKVRAAFFPADDD